MDKRERWQRVCIRVTGGCFLLVFLFVAWWGYRLQVTSHDEWERFARRQHQMSISLIPERGTIYDRSGEALAVSDEVDSIYLEPRRTNLSNQQIAALSKALSLPASTIEAKCRSDRGFTWLKRRVSPDESAAVKGLKLPGVNFIKEHRRFYPKGEIGAQVVGFTGLDPGGLEGLELKFDGHLLGRGGYLVTEKDALGRSLASESQAIRGASKGNDLFLTIDLGLQFVAEQELRKGVRSTRAAAGTVVMMEPSTGRVLAMASQPDYNPNAFHQFRPDQWRNRAICDTFEPGSTFKPFLVAAALNDQVVTPDRQIDCEQGDWRVGGRVIHDTHAYDSLSVAEILRLSSNIGTAKIGRMLGAERYYDYLGAFGFGSPTGIELPGERSGLIRDPDDWFEIDLAAASFGQGISVTALQMTSAMGAIANGGKLMAPYIVERIVDSEGRVVEQRSPRQVRRVISEETSRRMRRIMEGTTEEGGTGVLAAVPGFRVAGKTGTAQKADPVTGGYASDRWVASFVGFVPAEAPELVILVVLDEPQGDYYGGLVAGPIFSKVASRSLRHLGVSPTIPEQRPPLLDGFEAPPVLLVEASGGEGAEGRMPDLSGLSYRQVLQVMERTGLNIRLEGAGRAVEQFPGPGGVINYGDPVWVRFASPAAKTL